MDFRVVDLSGAQTEDIEDQLAAFDAAHFGEPPRGEVNLGIEVGGRLIAGAIAEMTAFRILYVSVVFVDEMYRRHGIGRRLMAELEKRGRALGADLIRLDTFDWQGVEFYRSLGYEEVGQYASSDGAFSEHFFLKRLG